VTLSLLDLQQDTLFLSYRSRSSAAYFTLIGGVGGTSPQRRYVYRVQSI